MKTKLTLLGLFFALIGNSNAQIISSVMPDLAITGPVVNTGIAIAPFYQYQAVVHDEPTLTNFRIRWYDNTGAFQSAYSHPGSNPDVAYYKDRTACIAVYENGGIVFANDYYISGISPVTYSFSGPINVAMGTNPNVDMNSIGNGVLCWENGGNVYACTFNLGTFVAGPSVLIGNGAQPDIVLLDTDLEAVITYVSAGQLFVQTLDHAALAVGIPLITSSYMYPPLGSGYEVPRIASQRQATFGPLDYYTVVAQEYMGAGAYDVRGFFEYGTGLTGPVLINQAVNNCPTSNPRPVVTYNIGQVDIAWAQNYATSCAGFPTAGPTTDVLMAECDYMGTNLNGPTTFLEVNNSTNNFANSATSLNSEYDGSYSVNLLNYYEGIVFNDPSMMFWKRRQPTVPMFRPEGEDQEFVSVIKAAEDQIIEVKTMIESDLETTFALYDNTGRLVALPLINQEGNTYHLDASQLTNGIYLLHCTTGDRTTAVRIPHFVN